MAKAAEEVGFDSIWLGDHLLYDGPERAPWEAWTLMGALAAVTEQGHGSGRSSPAPAFTRRRVMAKMASTIDEISQGRFVLGLGSGWNRREFDAFGIPYDKRVSRFEEAFAIISGLLDGERVTLDGTYHRADDVVLLPAPARQTPLMIGSNGPRMLGIAAAHVAGWNTWWDDYGNTPEGLAELIAEIGIPRHLERSACVLVQLDGQAVEREPRACRRSRRTASQSTSASWARPAPTR